MAGCRKYDDSALWNEVNSQAARIAKLEAWAETVNGHIDALQELVNGKRFITGVAYSPEPAPGYYTITFHEGDPIIIHNGAKGDRGDDGYTPQITAAEYPGDGKLYWKVNGEWLLNEGQMVPVTGDKGDTGQAGATPKVRINSVGNWEICATGNCDDAAADGADGWVSTGVPATGAPGATGPQGDAIFVAGGVDYTTSGDYVIFTLADNDDDPSNNPTIQVPTYAGFLALTARVDALNDNIDALLELVNGKRFITGVAYSPTPAPGHYTITFHEGDPIIIYNGATGATGATPQITVAEYPDDGKLYWKVNGEWLLNEGQMVLVTGDKDDTGQAGATPKVRINSAGNWEICTDGTCDGAAGDGTGGWESTTVKATGEQGATGPQGDAIFVANGIDYSDENYVEFTLADNDDDSGNNPKIKVPKYRPLSISFTQPEVFTHGQTRNINFTTTGDVQSITAVDVPRGWTVAPDLASSYIAVTAPANDGKYYTAAGTVTLLVSDDGERTITKSLALECPAYVPPAGLGIVFTQPGVFADDETKEVPFTLTGGATTVKVLDVPTDWTVAVATSGSAGTFTVTAPATMDETNIGGGEALIFVTDAADNTVMRPLKVSGSPTYAASTQVWKLGTQTWSDRITVPECNKEDFITSNTDPDCRSINDNGTLRYYYNWTYVIANATTMYPAPWRVPSQSDFNTLVGNASQNDLISAWGYGGFADGSSMSYVSLLAYYWSSTENGSNYAYLLFYYSGYLGVGNDVDKYTGFQVRCVK